MLFEQHSSACILEQKVSDYQASLQHEHKSVGIQLNPAISADTGY